MANDGTLSNLIAQFQMLPPGRRAVLVGTAAVSLAFFSWIASGAGQGSDRLLYRGLPPEEAAKVVDALTAERLPYRLADGGTSVYVPAGQVPEARIRLAGRGLPAGGGAGFELFDKGSFGVTEFVQRVNYRRALQGELARSIQALGPVERANVQIALPDPSPFAGNRDRQASASVVARLRPGAEFTASQVRGVVHLVASSVEGLSPENVTLVDGRGRMLAPTGDGPGSEGAPGATAYETQLEGALGARIEEMLGRTVGRGSVVAQVNADLDWTRRETTEERFDPNSQVERSEQRSTEESSEGLAAAGGVPGVQANVPDGAGGAAAGDSALAKNTTETINYEISKTVSHSVSSMAEIERLSLAILVDGKPGAEDGAFVPWSVEELSGFEELAKQAVGFSEERGDTITLTSAPFHVAEIPIEDEGGLAPEMLPLIGLALRGGLLLGALVLFAMLVVRPLANAVGSSEGVALPARVEELLAQMEAKQPAGELQPEGLGEGLPNQLGAVASVHGDESLNTIKSWLRQS